MEKNAPILYVTRKGNSFCPVKIQKEEDGT